MPDSILSRVKQQSPQPEELPASVRPVEKPEEEIVESKEENETPTEVSSEEVKPEEPKTPTEEEALENSKNPERTKEYIDKLKADKEIALKQAEQVKEEARKFAKEGPVATLVPDEPKFDWNKMLVNTPPPAQQFPNLTPKEVKNVMADIVDEQGYVNTDLLKETLTKADESAKAAKAEATRARQEAQQAKRSFDDFQRSAIAKEVHAKYPQLNPDDPSFNQKFWQVVHEKVLNNYVFGKSEGFMEAADYYADDYMKKEEKKEIKEQKDAIAQINATGTKGASNTRRPFGEHESLIKAVQHGTKGALGERLKRSGY